MATPLTMTVPEAAKLIGLSDSATYDAVSRGEIPALRIGRRILVKRLELLAMFPGVGSATGPVNDRPIADA
jgi:excisionase family DNA binding protein